MLGFKWLMYWPLFDESLDTRPHSYKDVDHHSVADMHTLLCIVTQISGICNDVLCIAYGMHMKSLPGLATRTMSDQPSGVEARLDARIEAVEKQLDSITGHLATLIARLDKPTNQVHLLPDSRDRRPGRVTLASCAAAAGPAWSHSSSSEDELTQPTRQHTRLYLYT